jgi:hypothetical protein
VNKNVNVSFCVYDVSVFGKQHDFQIQIPCPAALTAELYYMQRFKIVISNRKELVMSQIIACRTDEGIVLAADSKALEVDTNNEIVELKTQRMLQLTTNTVIVTGGSAEGEAMCRALKDFIAGEGLEGIEEVYTAALPFLATEYEKFMRKKCVFPPIDPIHQVFFILGGYAPNNAQKPFQLYLLWTKMKLPQLDGDEISSAYSVPRLMRLEYKLHQLSKENRPLEVISAEIRSNLEKQTDVNEDISGPFVHSVISRAGVAA